MIGPTLPEEETEPKTDASAPWVISDQLSNRHISRNKRLKLQVTCTSWLDRYEFEEVGLSLVSARHLQVNLTAQQRIFAGRKRQMDETGNVLQQNQDGFDEVSFCQALDRFCVWKTRMDSKLPHAAECTYQLAQILWRDYSSTASTEELRLLYCSAILRAVNGLVDSLQQQRAAAQSVAVLASELGIPSWLVDCRHEATHNQMPKLGVLRLAATTLLGYFDREYWQPQMTDASATNERDPTQNPTISSLAQHLLAYKQQQTKASTSDAPYQTKSSNKKSGPGKPAQSPPKKTASITDTGGSSSEDSDEDEIYLDAFNTSSGFWNPPAPSMGKTMNRFAALQESPKKKQRKTKEKIKKEKDNKEPSAQHYAKQFIKSGTNRIELAYQTALLFLVWGGVDGTPDGRGALIPGSATTFPETKDGIQKIRVRYGPLLIAIGKEWPGFLRTLMVHLIDFILSIESSIAAQKNKDEDGGLDAGSKRKLFFLESWVRYLVSRDFLVHFFTGLRNSKLKDSTLPAPWSFVEQMRYPMNSLCDRLSTMLGDPCQHATTQGLTALFINILGPHRTPNHGLDEHITTTDVVHTTEEMDRDNGSAVDAGGDDIRNGDASKPNQSLTLHEIEAMLGGNHGNASPNKAPKKETDPAAKILAGEEAVTTEVSIEKKEHAKNISVEDSLSETPSFRNLAWVRCSAWDPCAIGALPGYPCSS